MNCFKTLLFLVLLVAGLPTLAQTSNAVGDASAVSEECYSVTIPAEWQNGAVWFLETIDLTEPFVIDLKLNFGFNDDFGADGLVFVMQTVGTNLLGEPGGGLGFGGISPSFGVEFDTFQNVEVGDLFQDHIAIVQNGSVSHNSPNNLAGPVSALGNSGNIEDGQDHNFRLVWDPVIDQVEVYFDCELRITHSIDLQQDIFSGQQNVYWGFTGSTGGLMNAQSVCLDQFTLGLPEDVSLCPGESVQLGVNGPDDGVYEWSPVTGVSDPNIQQPEFSPTETTTYTVEYTDVCGEIQTDDITISVTELEVDAGPDQFICDGGMATFVATASDGATLTWGDGTPGDTLESDTEGGVQVVAELDGCMTFDEAQLTVLDPPVPNEPLPSDVEFCAGESAELDATCADCMYEWGISQDAVLTVTDSGVYTVEITNAGGCSSTYSTTVNAQQPPVPVLPETVDICEGGSATLNPGAGSSWDWSTGDTTGSISVSSAGVYSVEVTEGPCTASASTEVFVTQGPQWQGVTYYEICPGESVTLSQPISNIMVDFGGGTSSLEVSAAGIYDAVLTDPDSGCQSSQSVQVDALIAPTINLPESVDFCEGTVGSLIAEVFPESTPISWDNGENGVLLQIQEPGTYTAHADNQCGDASAVSAVGFVPCSCDAWVPNAFTPNYDGHNDTFAPVLECVPDSYVFRIFNRWGEVIFETQSTTEFWVGDVHGGTHFVPDGVYAWQLVYEHRISGDAVLEDLRGTVAVVR